MPRVLFVATVVKTHIMEFHIPYLQMFKDEGWETAVAARNDYEEPSDCRIPYCDDYYDIPFARNPLHPSNVEAYKKLKKVIDEGNYDIIHCHTPVGGMLGRFAARHAKKRGTKVVYTAHGFHFFKGAPLLNWLVYYPAERWMAHYTDDLITINKEDYNRAQNFKAKRVHYVPGVGIDLEKFAPPADAAERQREKDEKRRELMLKPEDFVILSVGELIKRKNHEVVIRAIAQIKQQSEETYNRLQYLICGRGVLEHELKQLTHNLDIEEHVHFLGYRSDICQICHASDLFVFMSFQEGLPVALMEAMACGLPVVCSDIRGNQDLVTNRENGILSENTPEAVSRYIHTFVNKELELQDDEEERQRKMQLYDLLSIKGLMCQIYFNESVVK